MIILNLKEDKDKVQFQDFNLEITNKKIVNKLCNCQTRLYILTVTSIYHSRTISRRDSDFKLNTPALKHAKPQIFINHNNRFSTINPNA